MDHISKEKAELHLRLGRTLAIFVKVDRFFESLTFDWIAIEKQEAVFKATLVRSINEGDEIFNDVLSFSTLNQDETDYDELTNPFFVGDLNDCYQWIASKYKIKELSFVRLEHLKSIYTDLCKSGAFEAYR